MQDHKQMPAAAVTTIVLDARLEMRAVRQLTEQLREAHRSGAACVIDGRLVQRVSMGCLQALAVFACSMGIEGREFRLASCSPQLSEALSKSGIADQIHAFRQETVL